MRLQNYMLTGFVLIIERLIIFLHVMGFYLIMKVQEEEKLLSLEKLRVV